jgi:TonB family protein
MLRHLPERARLSRDGSNLAVGAAGRSTFMTFVVARSRRLVTPFLIAIVLFGSSAVAAAQDGYRIVVNSSNPVSSLSRTQVSKLFLEKSTWDDGAAAAPVDQLPTSAVRDGFSRDVLGLPVPAAIEKMREVSKSGLTPPPAMATDRDVLAYVRLKPGAIGYVSPAADVTGVKVVAVGGKAEHAAASPGASPVAVGGRVAMPQRLVLVQPTYPAFAKQAHIQGTVEVSIVIDAAGNVSSAQVVKSISQLDNAALDAVRKWKYAPTVINGTAVPVTMVVQVAFTL